MLFLLSRMSAPAGVPRVSPPPRLKQRPRLPRGSAGAPPSPQAARTDASFTPEPGGPGAPVRQGSLPRGLVDSAGTATTLRHPARAAPHQAYEPPAHAAGRVRETSAVRPQAGGLPAGSLVTPGGTLPTGAPATGRPGRHKRSLARSGHRERVPWWSLFAHVTS